IPQGASILPTTYIPPDAAVQNYNLIALPKPTLQPNLKYLPLHLPQHNIPLNPISPPPIPTLSPKPVGGFNTILKQIQPRPPLKPNLHQQELPKTPAYLLTHLS
ncbi:SDR family oxidoreductase, partial [Staphylococcus epidermidis]|uniref:SDR family oxidoreductase n=1 Tax=Staphylococcus epidermidis TaxID=1282 RepID=UPI0016429E05